MRKPAPHERTTTDWDIHAVVFDLDGLMVDTEPIFVEVARRLLGKRGHDLVPQMLQAMMGTPAREALQTFRDHYRLTHTVAELATESWELFFEILGEQPAALLPGALELVDRLERRGVPRAIATSSSAAYVQRILAPYRLVPRFDFVLSADDVERGKPNPEVYVKAAARFGIAAARMLVLEDSVNGLKAAKAAGARCIVVPHDLVPREQLDAADLILPSLEAPLLRQLLGLE